MIDPGVLIVIGLLGLWGLAVGLLRRRFTRAGADTGDALTAAVALAFGLLLIAGGGLHGISVAPFLQSDPAPYDTRRVWLLTIGLILVYAGLVNVALYRRLKSGERRALGTAAGATTLLFVFLLLLHAASRRWILLPMSGAYLVLLLDRLRRSDGRAIAHAATAVPDPEDRGEVASAAPT